MAQNPNSRETFKQYCLRRLGFPVIKINVSEDQVDDRITDALQYYADHHYDGSIKQYYKYQVTTQDRNNGYITLPENIVGVVRIFPIGQYVSTTNFFDIRYQIALNDLYDLTSVSLAPYFITLQYLELIQQILVGEQPLRYNRHMNRVYIDMNWDRIDEGEYVVFECQQVIDPDEYDDVWNDRWLKKYATALIKRQWGENLTKFIGQKLPGGGEFNGERILNDAIKEIEELEAKAPESIGPQLDFYEG
ncbi:neck protein [Caulobacter phage Cr30]|uniref:neck protein n=1 Tax=Caulobacter phage Cr30 TaxID=1357714 RepID=UPI0004A9BAD4|nr:neck protein [Caulobacter phage Cr30]AGS81087.1 neck protein [Caulobacter phage Cr30]